MKSFDKDLCFGFNNLFTGIKKKIVHNRIMKLNKEISTEASGVEMITIRSKISKCQKKGSDNQRE